MGASTKPITSELGNKSPIDELKCKTSRYNDRKRGLIVRLFLFTFLANAMLLSIDIAIKPSKCDPSSSKPPEKVVNKVIKATNSLIITGILRQKRVQRRENHEQQQQQQSPPSTQMKRDNIELEISNKTKAQLLKTKQKRTSPSAELAITSGQVYQHQVTAKRFKTSRDLDTIASQVSTNNTVKSTMQNTITNQNFTLNGNRDINNNNELRSRSLDSSDINNNTLSGADDASNQLYQPQWQRNISSVDGTIDLSQYGRNDVDRLYGDALLVYLKNFNE